MKQFPILSGRCLVVELPEGATNPFVAKTYIDEDGHTYDTDPQWVEWSGTFPNNVWYLPDGNWRIIGMLSEVTEEQAAELVETHGLDMSVFKHYGDRNDFCETALESLDSAIVSAGYHLDFNPYGNESRVLSRDRCLLLGRKDV